MSTQMGINYKFTMSQKKYCVQSLGGLVTHLKNSKFRHALGRKNLSSCLNHTLLIAVSWKETQTQTHQGISFSQSPLKLRNNRLQSLEIEAKAETLVALNLVQLNTKRHRVILSACPSGSGICALLLTAQFLWFWRDATTKLKPLCPCHIFLATIQKNGGDCQQFTVEQRLFCAVRSWEWQYDDYRALSTNTCLD